MCKYDLHVYPEPCWTYLYRLVQKCRGSTENGRTCKSITIRQKHMRKEGPCRQFRACVWCMAHSDEGREAILTAWRHVKDDPLHGYYPKLSATGNTPKTFQNTSDMQLPTDYSTEYRGTTYYGHLPLTFDHVPKVPPHEPDLTAPVSTALITNSPACKAPACKAPHTKSKSTQDTSVPKPYAGPLIVHSPPIVRQADLAIASANTSVPQHDIKIGPVFDSQGFLVEKGVPWGKWFMYRDNDPDAKFSVIVNHTWNGPKAAAGTLGLQPTTTREIPQQKILAGYEYNRSKNCHPQMFVGPPLAPSEGSQGGDPSEWLSQATATGESISSHALSGTTEYNGINFVDRTDSPVEDPDGGKYVGWYQEDTSITATSIRQLETNGYVSDGGYADSKLYLDPHEESLRLFQQKPRKLKFSRSAQDMHRLPHF